MLTVWNNFRMVVAKYTAVYMVIGRFMRLKMIRMEDHIYVKPADYPVQENILVAEIVLGKMFVLGWANQ